ncbi:MAG: acyl-CoA thioesterase [Firmicutes bacterium]|nr:acyl-CoA thioesterase [Bacillota bacterium]
MTHTYLRKVNYYETDKMGLAHHANYIKWMEESRVAFLEQIGLPYDQFEEMGFVSPVVGLSVDYKTGCTFADTVAIQVWIERYTGVRLEVGYRMTNSRTGKLVATATSQHCFLQDGKVVSLKKLGTPAHEILERAVQPEE